MPSIRPSPHSLPATVRVALAAVLILGLGPVLAAPPPSAQRLTYLLEYIGSDYAGAVRDGAVTNQLEYGEVLRFVKELRRGYDAVPKRSAAVGIQARPPTTRTDFTRRLRRSRLSSRSATGM